MNRRSFISALAATPLIGCQSQTSNLVCDWDALATSRIKYNPQLGPIGDALMGAGLHTAIHRAWKESQTEKAISYAAYTFLMDRFGDHESRLAVLSRMMDLGLDPLDPSNVGCTVARILIAERLNDGSNYKHNYVDTTDYTPINQPMAFCNPSTHPDPDFVPAKDMYQWQPLVNPRGVIQKFAGPQMGWVKPFTLTTGEVWTFGDTTLAKPDYLKDLGLFHKECMRSLGYSARLNPASKLQVEFWADGPGSKFYPTAHWRYFTGDVCRRRNYSLERTIKTFLAVSTAAADAGIATWRAKRQVNGSRPITGIRNVYQGIPVEAWGGPGHPTERIYGETFGPFNPSDPNLTNAHQSPAFPGWPSGHAMFSGACARALQLATGSDRFDFETLLPDNFGIAEPHVPPVPTWIKFATFSEAARSAAMSRIWSGIHFAPDCAPEVSAIGAKIGEIAWKQTLEMFG